MVPVKVTSWMMSQGAVQACVAFAAWESMKAMVRHATRVPDPLVRVASSDRREGDSIGLVVRGFCQ